MFPSFQPDPFTSSERRRAFIKYSISEEDWRTRSGSSLIRQLQEETGMAIRRTDFFAVRREKFAEFERKDQLATLKPDELVPYALMNEQSDIRLTNSAQYRLRLTVLDPETQTLQYVYRSLSSDEHFTRGYIEEYASTLFSMGGEGYNFSILQAELHDVWIRPGAKLTA